jgi:plasmid stabilization system protein ParE
VSSQRIKWSERAFGDLEAIHEYVGSRNPDAARKLARQFLEAVELLETSPEAGPVAHDVERDGPYRSLTVRNYRIIYANGEEELVVVRVWDGRRDLADLDVG